jgi:hypothetical protein
MGDQDKDPILLTPRFLRDPGNLFSACKVPSAAWRRRLICSDYRARKTRCWPRRMKIIPGNDRPFYLPSDFGPAAGAKVKLSTSHSTEYKS